LLAFSRQQVLAPIIIDLPSLITDFAELLKLTLPENIEITADVADEISPLMLDVGQLENALLNLALNARDAMPSGGRLTIEARNRVVKPGDRQIDAAPGDYVTLSVTDSGTGMAPHVIKRAFEPFFTTKEVSKGSGLGLSMVYGFVAQSGGQVKIDSRKGIGTTVALWFPRGEVKEFGSEFDNQEARQPVGAMPTGRETILVVEDDEMVRSYVTDQLRSLGYSVAEADSAAAALTQLETLGPVDLLFTDIVMPGQMSGRELADEVAQRYPTTKILLTSGYTQKMGSDGGPIEAGVNVLTKPYYRQDLAVRVRKILDTP
jgi:CheY-like chemotaxis protein